MRNIADTLDHTPNGSGSYVKELAPRNDRSEISELTRTVEHMARQMEALVQIQMRATSSTPAPARDYIEAPTLSDRFLALLVERGKLTTVQLAQLCGTTKSATHHHIGALEARGLAVVVRGRRDPKTNRRGPDVVYHADHIAV